MEHFVVALQAVAQGFRMCRGGLGRHGALQVGDFLEEFFLLGNEIGDALALARVKGLVGRLGRGGGILLRDRVGGDGEAVDGEVRGGEGECFVNVLRL